MAKRRVRRPHPAVNEPLQSALVLNALSSLKLVMTAAILADQAYDREETPLTESMHEAAYAALHAELTRLHTPLGTGPRGAVLANLGQSIAGFLNAEAEDDAERQHRAVSASLAQLSYLTSDIVDDKVKPGSGDLLTLLLTLDQLFFALAEGFTARAAAGLAVPSSAAAGPAAATVQRSSASLEL